MNNYYIPEALQMVRSFLVQSFVDYTELVPLQFPTVRTVSLIGPEGYVPLDSHIPRDVFGRKMYLLAQINFSQITVPTHFPSQGLLQFYVSDDCLKTKQHHKGILSQNNFKVLYIENPISSIPLANVRTMSQPSYYPVSRTLQLQHVEAIEPVSKSDFRFDAYIPYDAIHKLRLQDELPFEEFYLQHFSGAQHKVGGYAYFIEEDLRKTSAELQHYDTLLLQIISNDAQGIMWGDSGVIKFFINERDLRRLSFENTILYVEDYTS